VKKIAVFAAALAVVPAGIAVAQSTGLKVTGGGQVVASAQSGGPGDTIAFNAQQIGEFDQNNTAPAKGQLQVVNRSAGTGQNQVRFHGTVTCIREFIDDQGTADPSDDERYVRFGGNGRDGTPFTVDAQDNGEGALAEDDVIFFRTRGATDDPCDDSDPATQLRSMTLARGNVQEH